MFENLKLRWFLVISALIFGLYFTYPSYNYYNLSQDASSEQSRELQDASINLGLDLKGGLHIILELDEKSFLEGLANLKGKNTTIEYEKLLNDAYSQSIDNNSNIFNELSQLAKKNNINLNRYFSNISRSSNNQEVITQIKVEKDVAMTSILEIMRNRIEEHDQYGLGEPTISRLGENRLMIELAGILDVSRAKAYIQRTADFELSLVRDYNQHLNLFDQINEHIKTNKIDFPILDSLIFSYKGGSFYVIEDNYLNLKEFLNSEPIANIINNNKNKIIWNNEATALSSDDISIRQLYLTKSNPVISGGMIQNPKAVVSDIGTDIAGQWVVNLDMNKEGRKRWSRFTGSNIDRQVAIVLDNKVFMAPFIRDKISSGSTQISGFASMQEAKDIAGVLKAGELPAPIKIIQTNYIGPSLGEDSIKAGATAMLMGLSMILLFMIIYYQGAGLIASIALLINLLLVFAVLVSMNAVLTLPGIAGLLLTVGMTVDANVIIFERIREEIKHGSAPYSAIKNGYNRAFETILDANITTLLTAFILSFIGSGPIKGFATTLSVGIICSMFTAIFVTRTIYSSFLRIRNIKKLSI